MCALDIQGSRWDISGSQGWMQKFQRYLWVPGTSINFRDICGSQECLHILGTSRGLSVGPGGHSRTKGVYWWHLQVLGLSMSPGGIS